MRKFMRTRPAPAAAHKPNGHANGGAANGTVADQHSTLPRYWSGSEGGGGWEDPDFPCDWRALGDRRAAAGTRWLRPHELCSRPRFAGDEGPEPGEEHPDDDESEAAHCEEAAARWRAAPGEVGCAALAAAAAALLPTPRLLRRVLPPHALRRGPLRFRFWVFGEWREVAVDDRLPTRGGRLLGSRPALADDFTLPLLEKAYAKLYGSYAAMRAAGGAARALQDLSGGVVQSFALGPGPGPAALALQVLHSAVPRATLVLATAAAGAGGLLPAQPYCVTGLARVRGGGGGGGGQETALLRLRAPSALGAWTGAWAAGGAEWRALAPADRELLAERARGAADFWMAFADFARAFSRLELVHVGPDDWLAEPALRSRRPWRAVLARRRWRAGLNAGGPPRCRDTAGANPQFHVRIPHSETGAGKCHVVVSVTQQYAPGAGGRLLGVGFAVYAAGGASAAPLRPLDVTHESRAREVVTFFTLPAGRYVVVPHTRRPHQAAAFLLRILTDRPAEVWEANEDNAVVRDVPAELLLEPRAVPEEIRAAVSRALCRLGPDEEVETDQLRAALRRCWRAQPSRELCRALAALACLTGAEAGAGAGAEPAAGAVPARAVPALAALLAYWRGAWAREASGVGVGGCGRRASSYRLRALLWACGVTASNKVLEGVVLRFGASLRADAFAVAVARLHVAHRRHRLLEARAKHCPLSLEELILITVGA